MSLNERIKEARIAKGITQEQLGSLIGVAKTTVAGYEKTGSLPLPKSERLPTCWASILASSSRTR